MNHSIDVQLSEIKDYITKQVVLQKEILTLSEAAIYVGVSRSFFYKLTSKKQVPFYRPISKLIFFRKSELDSWLLQNRQATVDEICTSTTSTNQYSTIFSNSKKSK